MTREELSKLAKENCRDIANATDYVDSAAYDGIIFGAKAEKEYLLEKAKEWISESYTSGVLDWKNCDSIIERFCKAMEE